MTIINTEPEPASIVNDESVILIDAHEGWFILTQDGNVLHTTQDPGEMADFLHEWEIDSAYGASGFHFPEEEGGMAVATMNRFLALW